MSGIFGTLFSNTEALKIRAQEVEIIGRNLQNVGNAKYARQRAVITDAGVVNGQSMGIEISEIIHLRDAVIDAQIVKEDFTNSSLNIQTKFNDYVENALGENVDRSRDTGASELSPANLFSSSGLMESINNFFNAFQELSSNPSTDLKQDVIFKTTMLTDKFHTIDQRLSSLDSDIETQINSDIQALNDLLSHIADLNISIADVELAHGVKALDLRDKRQAALEKLAGYINFEATASPNYPNQVNITIKDSTNADVFLVEEGARQNSIAYDGTNFTIGSPPQNVVVTGGSIHGAHQTRTAVLGTLRTQIDTLASQLVKGVNVAYLADFFDATGLTAADIAIDSAITTATLTASTTGDAADNDIAVAVSKVIDQQFSIGGGDDIDGSIKEYYIATVKNTAQTIASVKQKLEDSDLVKNLLESRRDSAIGVSVDEEMVDLLRTQKAFQAAARVVSTIDELLDVIVNRLKR